MWKWVERVKAILEILAILIAAGWAFTLYWNYDSPSNVMRADLEGKLSWAGRSKDVCEADYEVTFKNIGRVSIDIGRVRLSAFSMSGLDDLPETVDLKLIDPSKSISGLPLIQEETDRMNGPYAPDERDVETFSFIVKRSRGREMLFMAEVWKKEDVANSNAEPSWRDFQWDWVCGENPTTPEGGH
jgi:hypothetical protein